MKSIRRFCARLFHSATRQTLDERLREEIADHIAMQTAAPAYAAQPYAAPTYATQPYATPSYAAPSYATAAPSYGVAPAYGTGGPVAAVGGYPGYAGGMMMAQPVSYAPPMQPSYTLDSGDRLRVVVFGQDGLTNSYVLDASGQIDMTLIGIEVGI